MDGKYLCKYIQSLPCVLFTLKYFKSNMYVLLNLCGGMYDYTKVHFK